MNTADAYFIIETYLDKSNAWGFTYSHLILALEYLQEDSVKRAKEDL